MLGTKLSDIHTGYRAFSRKVLVTLPLLANSDDFVFDNQILAQVLAFGFTIGEISCPTRYFPEASTINLRRSIVYGLGVLRTTLSYRLWRWRLLRPTMFSQSPTLRLQKTYYFDAAEGRPTRLGTDLGPRLAGRRWGARLSSPGRSTRRCPRTSSRSGWRADPTSQVGISRAPPSRCSRCNRAPSPTASTQSSLPR